MRRGHLPTRRGERVQSDGGPSSLGVELRPCLNAEVRLVTEQAIHACPHEGEVFVERATVVGRIGPDAVVGREEGVLGTERVGVTSRPAAWASATRLVGAPRVPSAFRAMTRPVAVLCGPSHARGRSRRHCWDQPDGDGSQHSHGHQGLCQSAHAPHGRWVAMPHGPHHGELRVTV